METMLLAGDAGFDLNYLRDLLPEELAPEVQDKVAGIRHLVLKGRTQFIAQLQACDQEEDEDTREDLRNIVENPPAEFADALSTDSLRFLIVNYDPAEQAMLQKVIDILVREGLVRFDCTNDVRVLTA